MSFAHPAFLFLLPLAVLVAWRHLRRRRPALRFPDASLFAGLPVGRAARAKWGGAILRGLILAGLILAAANPRWPDLRTRIPVDGVAIVLVLDVSDSMGQPDYGTPPVIWGGSADCEHDWEAHIQPAANGIVHEGRFCHRALAP